MKPPSHLRLGAVALATLLWVATAAAQSPGIDQAMSLAQAERVAGDLKPGMSPTDVQNLLGLPRRTALKSDGDPAGKTVRRTLQWTYTWANSSIKGSLRVDFSSRAADDWYVNSWDWVNF